MNPFHAREIWPPGTVVDRKYIIRSTLGRGGFATAYLAHHRVLGHAYVIKRLHSHFAEDPEFIDRFVKEAKAIAELKGCPQIVEVFDVTQTEDGQLILVMEHMPGGDLAGLIEKEGRLSEADTIWYAQQIAEALKVAHAAGFVHRDVKPENVLLGADPKVAKLADFGIVADLDRAGATSITRPGSVGFAAPEQWEYSGKHLDGRTDIYALGATMYLMLAGRMPYGDLALREWVSAIQAGPPPSLRTILPSMSEELDFLVLEMLAVDREERPSDAVEVIARLKACSRPKAPLKRVETVPEQPRAGETPPLYTPTVKVDVARVPEIEPRHEIPRRPRKWAPIVVYALVAVLAGGLVYWAVKPKPNVVVEPPAPRPSDPAGATRKNGKDGLTYVWIPAGTFQMGCSPGDSECSDDERPVHPVTLTKGFWIGRTPVTQRAYRQVRGSSPSHFKGDDDLPVEQVNWKEAQGYCQAVGMRLPTEAEWEYAARGKTTGSRYGDLDQIAWHFLNSEKRTHPVEEKQANAFGLYDMLGNVSEWVADWYAVYPTGPQRDPAGPASGQSRVWRGSSWFSVAKLARVSLREGSEPENRSFAVGLRCAGDCFSLSSCLPDGGQ